MKTGQINVQTENIFPIIKKFLYSDHEIFLRELVSNAVDASQKLNVLAKSGEFKGDIGELKVEVILNKEEKTLTIRDRGIGMTADEIKKYIREDIVNRTLDEKAFQGGFLDGFWLWRLYFKFHREVVNSSIALSFIRWASSLGRKFSLDMKVKSICWLYVLATKVFEFSQGKATVGLNTVSRLKLV